MLACDAFHRLLTGHGIGYFAGVPDSLLKDICAYISDHAPAGTHLLAANEGAALAAAAGYHLATGCTGLVYLQNSGLGNLVNPLTSLTDPDVYSIPALLLIGWRGEPGVHDEPQHVKQGRVTPDLLRALEIPFEILPDEPEAAAACVARAVASTSTRQAPHALLVRKGTFAAYKLTKRTADTWSLRREEAIQLVLAGLSHDEIVVSTTGMTSREVFEYRASASAGHARDFLTVGCMGHASQIALGLAGQKPARQVFCLDGDGAALMHLGALPIIGTSGLRNFKHILLNNGAHDSVGGQPTVGFAVDFRRIAEACGYRRVLRAVTAAEISAGVAECLATDGPVLLEICVNQGARADLGRPTTSTHDNKREFMRNLRD